MPEPQNPEIQEQQHAPISAGSVITHSRRMTEKAFEFKDDGDKEEYVRKGAQLFQKLITEFPGASDFQFRTDLFVYVQKGRSCTPWADGYRLRAPDVAGLLIALYRSKSGGLRDTDAQNFSRQEKELMDTLAKDKKHNFACEGSEFEILKQGRIRGQAFFDHRGLAITCRILNERIVPLEDLRFSPDTAETLKSLVQKRSGLGLITGVTGAGKSTTLAALVAFIKDHLSKHVVTIEDPVEYTFSDLKEGAGEVCNSLITQREVGIKVDSFEQGLEDALREKPDIIMVGEIRSKRTMQTALEAVQSGHLVLSTMHTRGAAQTLARILEWFPKDDAEAILGQLSETLLFVLSQDLFPNANNNRDLVLCYELLVNTSTDMSSAIKKFHTSSNVIDAQILGQNGGIAWDTNLKLLVDTGNVTPEFAKNHYRKNPAPDSID